MPLRIASVKSNVGHMEAAAFGCALLKVLLMFERRTYAPVSRHFTVPNPDIDFTGLRVQTECEPFGAGPAVVGINSFGFGGANAHCLLTEYRPGRCDRVRGRPRHRTRPTWSRCRPALPRPCGRPRGRSPPWSPRRGRHRRGGHAGARPVHAGRAT